MAPSVARLPPQKTGKDFLASSHFTLEMDKAFLQDTKRNVAVVGPVTVGPVAAKTLPDSKVMHSSRHDTKLPVSHTKASFQSKGVATRQWNDYSGKLNTNFLSHSDEKCLSFESTSAAFFKEENALKFDRQGQKSLMTSSVPMGDKEQVKIPNSEVRGNFQGQSVDHIVPNRYPAHINYGAIDTLKTDRRKPPSYLTTNKELHSGTFDPAIKQEYGAAARTRGKHWVGLGNETTPEHSTNVRDSYIPQHFTSPRYNKKQAVAKVLGTTFLFGTEVPLTGTLDSQTTSNTYHTGTSHGITASMKPDNVFESNLPEGDRQPDRVKQLQNDTSYAEHFPVRVAPGVVLNPKVKGEDIITKSRVVLGTDNPILSAATRSCYVSQLDHIKPCDRVDQLVKFRNGFSLGSQIEYRQPPKSEIKDNFQENRNFLKFQHNPVVLSRLRDSHVSLSHEQTPEYSTSYNSHYHHKEPDPQGLAPKLQTSSLPLGTFSRYLSKLQ